MTIEQFIKELIEKIENNLVSKIIFSNFRNKEEELEKVIATAILIKNKSHIQFEYRHKRILNHYNIKNTDNTELTNRLNNLFTNAKDVNIQTNNEIINIKISKKLKLAINRKANKQKIILKQQNKEKNYFLNPNEKYLFLEKLGIQTKDGKIKKDKYNKFKQINKYLEFILYTIKQLKIERQIKILDFGSGKSYLTFSTYYYLKNILNLDVHIIGIDLKKETIDNCNSIAKELNYSKLEFVYGDVANYDTNDKIDIVISLHACDIATDIAILKSLKWQARAVLAVPCCQKEVNKQLKSSTLPLMLKHGIIKEKFSTLLTDSVRSEVLTAFGYKSDIIEFISEENTPKNILIRAIKVSNNINFKIINDLENYLKSINITMYLLNETKKIIND